MTACALGGGLGVGWMIPMGLVGLAFWGALIWLAVWAVRRFTESRPYGGARKTLEDRFARGEIDTEELGKRLRALDDPYRSA
jgi:uncharacterized membrane protein